MTDINSDINYFGLNKILVKLLLKEQQLVFFLSSRSSSESAKLVKITRGMGSAPNVSQT